MPFRLNWSDARRLWRRHVAWAVLVGLVGALAFAPSALAVEAEPLLLEVNPGAIDGSGYGEVVCEYKEGGTKVVEKECVELEFEGVSQKTVTLKAVPELGSEFVRFENGAGSASICNGTTKPSCEVILKENSYIEARFDEITPAFAVHVMGEGEVSCVIEAMPQGCEVEEEYEFDTAITLEPEPTEGSEFAGFVAGTGSASVCSGQTKPCSFVLEKDSTIEAQFVPIARLLTVAKGGTGQGTVASEPLGISCGATCSAKYPDGTAVTLKAAPAPGSTFAGWSGACSGAGSCVVSIEEANAGVTAIFTASEPPPPPPPTSDGEGTGTARPGALAKVSSGKAHVRLSCVGGPCGGTLVLAAKLRRNGRLRSVAIGRRSFSLAGGATASVNVKLSPAALEQLRKAHSLKARVSGPAVLAGAVKLQLAGGG